VALASDREADRLAALIDAVRREGGGVLVLLVGAHAGSWCAEALALAAAEDVHGALRAAREAVDECDDARSRLALGWALILAGHGAQGYPLFRAAHGRQPDAACPPLGEVATWMEDFDTARHDPDGGAELAFRLGDWPAARLRAGGYTRALLDAVTGDVTAARAAFSREPSLRAHAGLGLLELGGGDAARALVHLERAGETARATGLREPNVVQWAPDLIEAQVRLGRAAEARRSLTAFDRLARATQRRWALAAAARCRGLLAADVDAAFAHADRLAGEVPSPFERARLALCWGERLRRDGRRVEARRRLEAARAAFDALGAAPWSERAAAEIRASGVHARRGPRARGTELTAQEARIVRLVCQGLTNKGVAAQLFLSPRTVETHLAHAFRKLDVRTRTELAHVLAGREATASSSTM
jgi:DNA-binding CsgD family transcriptional regulator